MSPQAAISPRYKSRAYPSVFLSFASPVQEHNSLCLLIIGSRTTFIFHFSLCSTTPRSGRMATQHVSTYLLHLRTNITIKRFMKICLLVEATHKGLCTWFWHQNNCDKQRNNLLWSSYFIYSLAITRLLYSLIHLPSLNYGSPLTRDCED